MKFAPGHFCLATAIVVQCALFLFLLWKHHTDELYYRSCLKHAQQRRNHTDSHSEEMNGGDDKRQDDDAFQRLDPIGKTLARSRRQAQNRKSKGGGGPLRDEKRAILIPDTCQTSPTMQKFDEIYAQRTWRKESALLEKEDFYSNGQWPPRERRSASGPGSDLGKATTTSLQILRTAITQYEVSTMIDLPCGDANWIFDSWETDSLELYIGLDVVRAIVDRNAERLQHHSNKIFRLWDGTTCPLPKFQVGSTGPVRAADLVHSRDVLQHLSKQQGLAFLCGVFTSGARVFVSTSFPDGSNGGDIEAGAFVHMNLHAAPYNLPRGTCQGTHPDHESDETCVYDLTQPWVKKWIAQKNCPKVAPSLAQLRQSGDF